LLWVATWLALSPTSSAVRLESRCPPRSLGDHHSLYCGGIRMTFLSCVQRGRKPKPPRIMVYGVEGIGKSTFGSQAPAPIFLQTEDGLDGISCDRFPLAMSYAHVLTALGELRSEGHSYETVVIAPLDWLERLVWDRVCSDCGVSSIEKADGGFAK